MRQTKTTTVWYSMSDAGHDSRFSCEVVGRWDLDDLGDAECVAHECAKNYHSEHDGRESSWPLQIKIYATEDGPSVASLEVSRDVEPVFHVYAI